MTTLCRTCDDCGIDTGPEIDGFPERVVWCMKHAAMIEEHPHRVAGLAQLDATIDMLEKEVLNAAELLTASQVEVERLKAVLLEIGKGEGRYSTDPLTHAGNTVDDMKQLALDAYGYRVEAAGGGV